MSCGTTSSGSNESIDSCDSIVSNDSSDQCDKKFGSPKTISLKMFVQQDLFLFHLKVLFYQQNWCQKMFTLKFAY